MVRQAGESHPPAEYELPLHGCTDLDEQIDWLVDTTKSPKVNSAINRNDSESEESDENDLIKDIANDFSAEEKTGTPIRKNLANIINNVIYNSVIREKLVQELQENSLKIKKCNPDIWSEMVQSNTRSKDLKT